MTKAKASGSGSSPSDVGKSTEMNRVRELEHQDLPVQKRLYIHYAQMLKWMQVVRKRGGQQRHETTMLTECKELPITEAVGDSVINELRSNKLSGEEVSCGWEAIGATVGS